MNNKISIVVPTYGRTGPFIKLVDSIRNSNISKENYEILVVSSDPVDSDKVKWINEQTDVDITLMLEADRKSVRNRSLYYYENVGIKKAKYDWILVCNDDMWVEPDWYEKFLPHITTDNKVYLVASHIGTRSLGLRIPTIGTLTINDVEEPLWLYDMTIIHRSVYETINYLDESIAWYGKGADLAIAVGFLTNEKAIPCYDVSINHDIVAEHRGDNISTSPNGDDFTYIRNKWDNWILYNNANNKYNWV